MSTKIKSEDVFTGHNILELAHQFYYEQHLLDSSNELYYKIVHNFWCHIGNVNYYSVDKNAMKNFFEIGFDLYLITNTMCPDITEAMDKTISAIKYFNLEHNKDYDIRNGSISLTQNAENKIHNQLEELISKVGGRTILKLLFENEFQPKYNKQFERYMITKNKQLSLKSPQTPIPYNYIMKMCLKHLDKDFVPFLTPAIEHDYIKLIKDSMNFIDVLGIYSSNPMSETQMDSLGLIDKVQQAHGREVVDLTVTQLNLFHIRELRVGEFNHAPYNLGWGHHHCNIVVKDSGIYETLDWMRNVIERNDIYDKLSSNC